MNANEFQTECKRTAIHCKLGEEAVNYAIVGLVGEAGELANKWKKTLRGDTPLDSKTLIAELGDVLWYAAELATQLGYDLGDVMAVELHKLQKRQAANTLRGFGDDR